MDHRSHERPSKRRRRESSLGSLPEVVEELGRGEQQRRERSPQASYWQAERSREQERSRDQRNDQSPTSRSNGQSRTRRQEGQGQYRSRGRDRDRESRRHRDRSSSPRPEGHKYRRKDHERNRSVDRGSGRLRDREYDRKERDRHQDRNREQGRRRSSSPQSQPLRRSRGPLTSQNDAFASSLDPDRLVENAVEKQKPNFGLTGKLAAASNTVQTGNQTIILKYHEPSEARKPSSRDQWRLYVFKEDEIVDTVELSEQSCWLFGREAAVADFPIEHASCSKQHAVIQFRYIEKRNEFGDKIGKVKPYLIDLESANGTTVNEELAPAAKYVELRDKDVLRFGHSSREYVIQLPPSK